MRLENWEIGRLRYLILQHTIFIRLCLISLFINKLNDNKNILIYEIDWIKKYYARLHILKILSTIKYFLFLETKFIYIKHTKTL